MRLGKLVFALFFGIRIYSSSPLAAAQNKAIDFNDVIRKSEPLSPEQERAGFHLPPGFDIQLVASEPEINKPINITFDAAGRLWVTSTIEYPHPAKDPEKARDSIKVLSDFDASGRAKKVVTFAQGLNIPIGVLPYGSGAIGHSIPFIHYFQDTTGAGISDKSSVLLDRIGFQKDTHGMSGNFVRGFDGWIYATHGFNNDSTIKALDGSEIKINSGNTYRFRPDGSHIEQYTWGQVNPFGLALDPLGNLYSADCHTLPIYQLLRGGHYPSFGKKDDGLGFAPTMMKHLHGSTAIGGIVIYSDIRFPEEFRNNGFVGNVMTCKINRDKLVDTGTTRTAVEMPDFLSADDPWFRPVSMTMGPDGAMYVADFYNRIIGHYEVALTHPGRDRERGRIWRITYKGTPEKQLPDVLPPDLSKKSADELIALTGETNLTLRMLAMWQLVDRIGKPAIAPLDKVLTNGTPNQKICALWALYNLKRMDETVLSSAYTDPDPIVRTHVMKVLAEIETWSEKFRSLALVELKDGNPWVQRAAADALGVHPSVENVRPLIALRMIADPKDTHLVYAVRMALRNQLLSTGIYEKIVALNLDEKDMQVLADVALGAASEDAAAVLVKVLSTAKVAPADAAKYFEHAMKFLPFNELDGLAASARARYGSDMGQQLALLKSIQDGAARRGIELSPNLRAWAAETIGNVLTPNGEVTESFWTALALDGATPNPANPWVAQQRVSSDQKMAAFLCSLPLGEKLTGIYRSKPFDIPAHLSFYIAGHNGAPGKVHEPKNFVRLRDVATKGVLFEALPPRNDTAQKLEFDLAQHAGKKGFLELIDGDDGGTYAWLAVGRFAPAIAEMPNEAMSSVQKIQSAVELAGLMKLSEVETKVAVIASDKKVAEKTRSAAIEAVAVLNPKTSGPRVAGIARDMSESVAIRESAAMALNLCEFAEKDAVLIEALRGAPDKSQTKIALAMCASTTGADKLVHAISDGKASPRLLLNRGIADRLGALAIPGLLEKVAALTKGIPPVNDEIQKAINARVKNFRPEKASIEVGAKVFEKNCMVCHQLDGKGKVIGPQLDGVGARGLDRIVEDVLDPSRNVDAAFRMSVVKLTSGQVYSGLKRRDEGEQIVFADSKGEETSLAKKDIQNTRETQNSLMPDGFAETISQDDFNHLMAFLLAKTVKR